MTPIQKTIKYAALVFALILAFNIIMGILSVFAAVTGGLGFIAFGNKLITTEVVSEEYLIDTYIENIDVSTNLSNLKIVTTSDEYAKVEVNNVANLPKITWENSKLVITEESLKIKAEISENSNITVYIPEDFDLKNVKISTGVGKADITNLNCDTFNLEVGIGKLSLENIIANTGRVSAGVGNTKFTNASFESLRISGGVGEFTYAGDITSDLNVDGGIGEINIRLNSDESKYQFDISKGIGNVYINRNNTMSDSKIGNGNVDIRVSGGIGTTRINTK